jgi:hypothetical protein
MTLNTSSFSLTAVVWAYPTLRLVCTDIVIIAITAIIATRRFGRVVVNKGKNRFIERSVACEISKDNDRNLDSFDS